MAQTEQNNGRALPASQERATAAEPEVSALRDGIPSAMAQDLFLRALAAYHAAPAPNLGKGRAAAGAVIDAAFDRLRQENQSLRADLGKYAEGWMGCEACGAPLFEDDDFVSDDCAGCWAALTDAPDAEKQKHPCYAYRVGKPDARLANTAQAGETQS